MTAFKKPARTAAYLVDQWVARGLAIPDRVRAERYLSTIGYYRLSAYTLPFQVGNPNHQFKPDASFVDVLDLYVFDRQLRLQVMDAIERIEVAIRARLNNHMSHKYGPHWYLQESLFKYSYNHKWLLAYIERETQRSKETFLRHYKRKYTSPRLPPGWMMVEILTYGQLSVLYDNLANTRDKKEIAGKFNIPAELLRSWMQAISYVRNLCAHHSRLWNRELGNAPKVPQRTPGNWIQLPITVADPRINTNKRLYLLLVIIEYLLRQINPGSSWHERLYCLMRDNPGVSKPHMGMPDDWHTDPFWRLPI